LQRED